MDLSRFLTEPCTIRHRGFTAADGWGDESPIELSVTATTCQIERRNASELLDGQTTVLSTHRIVLAAGTPVGAHDLVEVGGETFSVVGHPSRPHLHALLGSGDHHVEVDVVLAGDL